MVTTKTNEVMTVVPPPGYTRANLLRVWHCYTQAEVAWATNPEPACSGTQTPHSDWKMVVDFSQTTSCLVKLRSGIIKEIFLIFQSHLH